MYVHLQMGRPPTIDRAKLLATARAVFAQKGFDAATLADIAKELSVTPAAVLRHFPSKRALFETALHTQREVPPFILDVANAAAGADPRVVLRGIAEQYIPFAQRM